MKRRKFVIQYCTVIYSRGSQIFRPRDDDGLFTTATRSYVSRFCSGKSPPSTEYLTTSFYKTGHVGVGGFFTAATHSYVSRKTRHRMLLFAIRVITFFLLFLLINFVIIMPTNSRKRKYLRKLKSIVRKRSEKNKSRRGVF